jgi:hypothetical protein
MAAEKQIQDLLQELGSAARAQQTPAGIVDRALSRVNEAEQPGGLSMRWKRAAGKRWRPRRLAMAAAAVGAAALVVVLGVSALSPSGDGGVAQAATVLRDVAKVAAAQPQTAPWVPGSFYYHETFTHYGSLDQHREEWTATDGQIFYRYQEIPAKASDQWHQGTAPSEGGNLLPFGFGAEDMTYAQLMALPTNPDALEARMKKAVIPFGDRPLSEELFGMVEHVLSMAPAPPEVRAAFYEVAARIPGVKLLGETKDSLGRTGVAVALDEHIEGAENEREIMVFNPDSSELMEERTVAISTVRECDGGDCETYKPGETIGFRTSQPIGVVEQPYQLRSSATQKSSMPAR